MTRWDLTLVALLLAIPARAASAWWSGSPAQGSSASAAAPAQGGGAVCGFGFDDFGPAQGSG